MKMWGLTNGRKRPATALFTSTSPLSMTSMMMATLALSRYVDQHIQPTALSSYSPIIATSKSTESSDCVSSTALLLFRGIGAGLAWTIGVDGYVLLNAPDAVWQERVAQSIKPTTPVREMARTFAWISARNMFGFAGFLGIFGGVSCSLETLRGRKDLLNPFIGGFSAGLALSPGNLRTPRAIISSAAFCGVASVIVHFFVPAAGESKQDTRY